GETAEVITSHVLDIVEGQPAPELRVRLERETEKGWVVLGSGVTDVNGRVQSLVPAGSSLKVGNHRLIFETGSYFAAREVSSFYPQVIIVFYVADPSQHYHIPLLLSRFGYTTYRGS